MARFDAKSLLNAVYNATLFNRRVRVLAGHLADAIPYRGTVLDVGAGDGAVAGALMQLRPDLRVEGVDVAIRPVTHIPVTPYDGVTLPFADQSFDYVIVVDVLHHTDDPALVLAEAARVSRNGVVLKDHLVQGLFAEPVLRLMDWAGNWGNGVVLAGNYLTRDEWQSAWYRAGLIAVANTERLGLYPPPFSWVFDRNLHFVAVLRPRDAGR